MPTYTAIPYSPHVPTGLDQNGNHVVGVYIVDGTLDFSGSITATPPSAATVNATGVITVGTTSQTLLTSNSSRVFFDLQNTGTNVIFVLYGAGTAGPSNYTYALRPGSTLNDASSIIVFDFTWKGAVQIAASSSGGQLSYGDFNP